MELITFALSDAWRATIAMVLVWFVGFPALVTGLIVVAVVGAIGERAENQTNRRFSGGR
jgi:hypothetical protein